MNIEVGGRLGNAAGAESERKRSLARFLAGGRRFRQRQCIPVLHKDDPLSASWVASKWHGMSQCKLEEASEKTNRKFRRGEIDFRDHK